MQKVYLLATLLVAMVLFPACETSTVVDVPPGSSLIEGSYTVSGLFIEGRDFTTEFRQIYDFYVIDFEPDSERFGTVIIEGSGQDPFTGRDFPLSLIYDYEITENRTLFLSDLNGNEVGEYDLEISGREFLLADFAGSNLRDLDELVFPRSDIDTPYIIGPGDLIEIVFVER